MVSKSGIVTDGPFGEAKEVVGGYWFIVARSLREAAEIAAQNPCAQYGLEFRNSPPRISARVGFQHYQRNSWLIKCPRNVKRRCSNAGRF